jgi:hypothetical protein
VSRIYSIRINCNEFVSRYPGEDCHSRFEDIVRELDNISPHTTTADVWPDYDDNPHECWWEGTWINIQSLLDKWNSLTGESLTLSTLLRDGDDSSVIYGYDWDMESHEIWKRDIDSYRKSLGLKPIFN